MNIAKSLLVLALLTSPGAAWATSGNDLVKWIPEYEASKATFAGGLFIGYVTGIADFGRGFLFCPAGNVTNGQNAAIVVKYLKNNPEKWNWQASTLVVEALSNAYPKCPDVKNP